jgi:drug/metabolite transporter (DMT)-like permease
MKQLMRALFDFDFTLFCAGACGLFLGMSVVFVAIQHFSTLPAALMTSVSFLFGALYGRKLIKTALTKYVEERRGEQG